MDEQHNPFKSELKFLERLSIEELEALLKLSGDPDDVELFDTVVEEVVAREKENPTGRLPDVDAAWDELQMMYQNMPVEERRPLPLSEGISSAGDHGSRSLASTAEDKPRRVSFRKVAYRRDYGRRCCTVSGVDGGSPGGGSRCVWCPGPLDG